MGSRRTSRSTSSLSCGLGRGDGDVGDWCALHREAARLHNDHTAQYLLGKPLLADHLDEGLSRLGYSRFE